MPARSHRFSEPLSRREFVGRSSLSFVALAALTEGRAHALRENPVIVKPTPQQLAWQEAELTMFLHFGMNTFTDREWGDGAEDPMRFNPTALDCKQWVQIAKEAGFKYLILTAKHHDGFCLWPSRFTDHSVRRSPWKGGQGDVVREFSQAVHAAGLKMGLYLSPWDRHEPTYGDSPAYNAHFVNQLTELLSNYGEVAEVWFDGACGEGPNGKRQEYDWTAFYRTVRRLQPRALIAISGPDIRWVGNEDGVAHETEWSVRDADPAVHGPGREKVWWPAECDTSIRPGWFWHRSEDDRVKSLEQLLDIYYKSVGRNSVLLLNVPPNDRGLISDPDIARLRQFRSALDRSFEQDLARGKPVEGPCARRGYEPARAVDGSPRTYWAPPAGRLPASIEVVLGEPAVFDVVLTQEYIAEGQRVEAYTVDAFSEGAWRQIAQGSTVGHKKLDRCGPVTATRVRWTVQRANAQPLLRAVGLYRTQR